MKIRSSKNTAQIELPFEVNISFNKVIDLFKKYASNKEHPFYKSAKVMLNKTNQHPELYNGFSDLSLLEKHNELIDVMLEALFPEILTLNEIKAASTPFMSTAFKFTERFENIIQNAGDDFSLDVRNLTKDEKYLNACVIILAYIHNYPIDLKRPFLIDIPDKKTDITRHYRTAFNGDFIEIETTEKAPKITEEDIKELLDNFDNINIWKEKFPPNSYKFKGFALMNLFDVTTDESISAIRTDLLRSDDNLTSDLQKHLADFYNIKDLKVGYSIFDSSSDVLQSSLIKNTNSIILDESVNISCDSGFFCEGIIQQVFKRGEAKAISDVEKYGLESNMNQFYHTLKSKGVGSIILLPIKANKESDVAILEITSPRAYELNSINQSKLKDLIPVFKAAAKRSSEEYQNKLEATIQEHYTSIHPTVKWRFYEAANKFHKEAHLNGVKPELDDIIFQDVYPLFGQSDIKGSSIARNEAIKEDLTKQLTLAIKVLKKAKKTEDLPIYKELTFRVNQYLTDVKDGLKAGDEIGILDFLKKDIYPVFNHIKALNNDLSHYVNKYTNSLDSDLQVVYDKRKDYEHSVTLLNDKLSHYIDTKQEEAQAMFPHYFERYKTDGVEYNMYIGQSLVKDQKFDDLYLYNLRLWQLQIMCELENVAQTARQEMEHDLQVASLILVHSNPLSIKFRMDEKQFDVDGAYNIRYEIIKKRIDKAHIKDTEERLTVPGKIAIVYSQDKDAKEYLKYINYLQSKNLLGEIEQLEIEDLQGVSGLKALRVDVIYQKDFDEKQTITFNDLIEEIKG